MAGKSVLAASDVQKAALRKMACGADRAEADRARAMLLTLAGWTSARIAEAFGVREDTVRLWRGAFMRGGIDELKTRKHPGPEPHKSGAALRVAEPLLNAPVADRANWTLARLAGEIRKHEGLSISRSQLSKTLRKKGGSAGAGRDTP
jgi:transposase